jgi:multisubunit Na+/H+ antiporter MnhB subunit
MSSPAVYLTFLGNSFALFFGFFLNHLSHHLGLKNFSIMFHTNLDSTIVVTYSNTQAWLDLMIREVMKGKPRILSITVVSSW